jgi:AAA+ superfamily predicted ATPase
MTAVPQARAHEIADARPFTSSAEQLDGELEWLRLRLKALVERDRFWRSLGPPAEYRGMFVADDEVDALMETSANGAAAAGPDTESLRTSAESLRAELDARSRASREAGVDLLLDSLAERFGLGTAERALVLAAFSTHVDRAWEKVWVYANDDVAGKRPTVGVLLDALADDRSDNQELRRSLRADAPLRHYRLLDVVSPAGGNQASMLSAVAELDRHVAGFLLGQPELDLRLAKIAFPSESSAEPPSDIAGALERAVRNRRSAFAYLGGRWPWELRVTAQAGAAAAGFDLLRVDSRGLRSREDRDELLNLLARDSRLLSSALLMEDWGSDDEHDTEADELGRAVERTFVDHPYPVLFAGKASRPTIARPRMLITLDIPSPSLEERTREWARELEADALVDRRRVAATFRFGREEIHTAARMAEALARSRGDGPITDDDVRTASRMQSQPPLSDLVLPDDSIEQLREIVMQALHQDVVYEDWGFGAKSSIGRGVAALFVGDPGTGKTMAAEIIASELGLDLYKIDLSGLVSKYIGETEKNLARVFDEAADSNTILFFDEADALFGKRTEVRDSHDRYANIEVSYLLQKMEEYAGIVILASNLQANLDEAFQRRLKAIIDFPFPDEEDRQAIYEHMLEGVRAPIDPDVDLAFMARRFRIAGGNIRNVVVLAAFLAAEGGQPIAMQHFMRATRREFQKLGRLSRESDFDDSALPGGKTSAAAQAERTS